jgi:hypothetical protein
MTVLEQSRIENYAGGVYVLKTNLAGFEKSACRALTQHVSIEAEHRVRQLSTNEPKSSARFGGTTQHSLKRPRPAV